MLEETQAIFLREAADVGKVTSREDCITQHVLHVFVEADDGAVPTLRFVGETNDELLSSLKLQLNLFLVTRQLIELLLSL